MYSSFGLLVAVEDVESSVPIILTYTYARRNANRLYAVIFAILLHHSVAVQEINVWKQAEIHSFDKYQKAECQQWSNKPQD